MFISDILFLDISKSFNSLKLTFSKIFTFDILLLPKFNFSNFKTLTFLNTFISNILLSDKFNSFISIKLFFYKLSIFDILFNFKFKISKLIT